MPAGSGLAASLRNTRWRLGGFDLSTRVVVVPWQSAGNGMALPCNMHAWDLVELLRRLRGMILVGGLVSLRSERESAGFVRQRRGWRRRDGVRVVCAVRGRVSWPACAGLGGSVCPDAAHPYHTHTMLSGVGTRKSGCFPPLCHFFSLSRLELSGWGRVGLGKVGLGGLIWSFGLFLPSFFFSVFFLLLAKSSGERS